VSVRPGAKIPAHVNKELYQFNQQIICYDTKYLLPPVPDTGCSIYHTQ